ncbi:MAG: hypothetical protein U5M23_10170 [Marinagarivorans sp.]|nr:hypothetical protein [Marinagarivorans sp.]
MRFTPALLGAMLIAPYSFADIQFNGFLSAVGGKALDSPINGYEKDITFNNDSLFGLQARADISEKLSVTGQIVSLGENDFATELAWGYIAYKANNNLTLRMGRFRIPLYYYSDFLDVAYAYPWVSPSDDVYNLQLDNINGMDAIYKWTAFNAINVELQAYYGAINGDYKVNNTDDVLSAQTRDNLGFVASLGYSGFTLRTSVHQAQLSINNIDDIAAITALKTGVNQLTGIDSLKEAANNVLANLTVTDVASDYYEVALHYDGDYFFAVAEVANFSFESGPFAEQKRSLFSLGAPIGATVIYGSYSKADDESVNLSGELAAKKAGLDTLVAGLNALSTAFTVEREIRSLGVRYDFEPGAAFKVQYDNIEIVNQKNSNNVLRFGIDVVF